MANVGSQEEDEPVTGCIGGPVGRSLGLPSLRQWVAQVQSRQPLDVQSVPVLDAVREEREVEQLRLGERALQRVRLREAEPGGA